jgi:hypothetical protein
LKFLVKIPVDGFLLYEGIWNRKKAAKSTEKGENVNNILYVKC